jgi:hypothetical protein
MINITKFKCDVLRHLHLLIDFCFISSGGYIYFETSFLPMIHDLRVAQTAYMESSVLGSTGPEGKCVGFR